MARKKSGEKEARWREIVERQAGSGLSVRSFCADEGISEPSFYAWRRKLRSRKDNGRRTPQKPRGRDEAPDNARLFVPLTLLGDTPTLEIIHPLGYGRSPFVVPIVPRNRYDVVEHGYGWLIAWLTISLISEPSSSGNELLGA